MENKKNKEFLMFRKFYLYFMLYSIIGWLYEVFLEVIVYKWGFTNRGVLFGPYCPVYGFGAIVFLLTIYKIIKEKKLGYKIAMIPVVFLLCMIIATFIELITSYICEAIMGYWPWQTYSDYKINFQARIALSPSIRFGIGGVFFLYVLQPIFEFFSNKLSSKQLKIITNIVGIIFVLDIIVTIFIAL